MKLQWCKQDNFQSVILNDGLDFQTLRFTGDSTESKLIETFQTIHLNSKGRHFEFQKHLWLNIMQTVLLDSDFSMLKTVIKKIAGYWFWLKY